MTKNAIYSKFVSPYSKTSYAHWLAIEKGLFNKEVPNYTDAGFELWLECKYNADGKDAWYNADGTEKWAAKLAELLAAATIIGEPEEPAPVEINKPLKIFGLHPIVAAGLAIATIIIINKIIKTEK